MIKIWNRIEDKEDETRPRVWRNRESDDTVKIEEFENGTWDTFRNETLVSNHDTEEEAIERGEKLIAES